MDFYRIFAIAAAAAPLAAAAVTVDTAAPGTLRDAVTDLSVTELTVNGPVDAADFEFIAYGLTSLRTLDLSGATVAAYDGEALLTGLTTAPAGCLPDNALFGSSVTKVTLPPTLRGIGDNAFAGSAIGSLSIPASVTSIGQAAFAGCPALRALSIPAGCVSLGSYLAAGAPALAKVEINGPVDMLPDHAFDRCVSLAAVAVPASVKGIGAYAFNGCKALKTFKFPASLTALGDFAFNASGLTEVRLAASPGLTAIGAHAFGECQALTRVTLPDMLVNVGVGAFFMDTAITEISLPSSVTVIDDLAFAGLGSLAEPAGILHSGITEIKDCGIARWRTVASVTLPRNLVSLGDRAMEHWDGLTTITAVENKTVPALGSDVWYGITQSDVLLNVEERMVQSFEDAEQWRDFNIKGQQLTSVAIVHDSTGAGVRAYFADTDLNILSEDDMTVIRLYDTDGVLLLSLEPHDTAAVISTAGMSAHIYIVQVTTAGDRTATLKLMRR